MVILIFFFIMGYFGAVYSLGDTFGMLSCVQEISGWLLLFTLLYLILYAARKWARFTLSAAGALYVFLAVRNLDSLKEGGLALIRMINSAVLQYTGISEGVQELTLEAGKSLTAFLLFACFLWGALLFFGIFVKGGKVISILNLVLGVGASLAVGKVPGITATCLMMFCCLGAFASSGVRKMRIRWKTVLLTGAIGVFCLLFGRLAVVPLLEPAFADRQETKARIQDTSLLQELLARLPDLTGGFLSKGGMSKGDLSGTDAFLYSGETALEVRSEGKPEETIYLRGFIGEAYTGEQWVPPGDSREEMEDHAYTFAEDLTGSTFYTGPRFLSVTRLEADDDFEYRPYFSRGSSSSDGDFHQYDYFPVTQIKELMGEAFMAYSFDQQGMLDQDTLQKYLDYPQQDLERLKQFADENPVADGEDAEAFIRRTLAGRCSYNLQAGRLPSGEDFAENFFFEKQQGYCVHFATTAVLLFRMYGIPARYAEGYIAPAKDFKKEGDSYLAKVTDERAHAWVEVYTYPQGWMPVEVTPGFSGASSGQQESGRQEQPESAQAANRPENQQSRQPLKEASERNEDGNNGIFLMALQVTAAAVGILAAAVFLLMARREWICKKRRKAETKELFPDLYRILLRGGWEEKADCQSREFPSELARVFTWMDEKEFTEVMDIVMRANYSGQPVTREEERRVRTFYDLAGREVYSRLPRWKKIRFRYLDGL